MEEIMDETIEQVAKPDLVRRISKKVDRKYSQEEIFEVLNAALDSMVDVVAEGNKLTLNGYFTIYPKYYKERMARNVYANTPCKAPARYKPGIEFGSKFMEVCKKFTKERLSENED